MKKFILFIVAVLSVFSIQTVSFADETAVTVQVDDTAIEFPDAQPFIDSRSRTLVPIRFVSEAMGADVIWENETKTVVINKDKDTIKYTIGDFKGYLNGIPSGFDSCGILKEDRTFVPLRFISEMLCCKVDWDKDNKVVSIVSPGEAVAFPEPQITVHYPESESDKRLLWITVDNYRDFERNCKNYEFKVDFKNPKEFNTFEQDEGAILGWQSYSRNTYAKIVVNSASIFTVSRGYYATREDMKTFKPKDGDKLEFTLTVCRKCSGETKEYEYTDILRMPYPIIDVEE